MAQKQAVGMAVAKFDYKTNDSHELNISKGEKLTLLDDTQHWWQVMNSKGETGYVPSNFCKKSKQSIFSSLRNTLGRKSKSKEPAQHQQEPCAGRRSLTASPNVNSQHLALTSDDQTHKLIHRNGGPTADQSFSNRCHDSRNTSQTSAGHQQPPYHSMGSLKSSGSGGCLNLRPSGPPNFIPYNQGPINSGDRASTRQQPQLPQQMPHYPLHKPPPQRQQQHNGHTPCLEDAANNDERPSLASACVAKFSYTPCQPDELTLARGDAIRVLERSSDGWWRGELLSGGGSGWFPSNYVTLERTSTVRSADQQHSSSLPSVASVTPSKPLSNSHHSDNWTANHNDSIQQPHRFSTVLTLYPFSKNQPEEMSFDANEILEVLARPPDDPDWWRCRGASGEEGLVPRNYVKPLASSSAAPPLPQGPPRDRPWYWGGISRLDCESMLVQHGYLGQFVVRDSESHPGDLTVTAHAGSKCRNFKVHLDDLGQFTIGQKVFPSVDVLLQHYRLHPIYKGDSERLFLTEPLRRAAQAEV